MLLKKLTSDDDDADDDDMEDGDGDDDDWHKFGNISRGFREACQLVGRGISNTSEFSSSYPARPNSPNSSFTCRLRSVNTDTDTDTDTDTLISSSRHTTLPLRPGAPHHLLSQEVWDSNKKLVWGWLWNDGGSTGASTVKESTESAETIRLLQNVCHSLITPHVVAIRRPFQLFLTFFSFLGSPSPPTVHFPSHVACSFLSNTIP